MNGGRHGGTIPTETLSPCWVGTPQRRCPPPDTSSVKQTPLPLPPPSSPEIQYGLYFYGIFMPEYKGTPANSIPPSEVIDWLLNNTIVSVDRVTLEGKFNGEEIPSVLYRAWAGQCYGHGTAFFSADPSFTGNIP